MNEHEMSDEDAKQIMGGIEEDNKTYKSFNLPDDPGEARKIINKVLVEEDDGNDYIDKDKLFDSLIESSFIMFPELTSEERRERTEKTFLNMAGRLCKPGRPFIGGFEPVVKIIEDMDGEEDIFSKDQFGIWKQMMRRKRKGIGWLMCWHGNRAGVFISEDIKPTCDEGNNIEGIHFKEKGDL